MELDNKIFQYMVAINSKPHILDQWIASTNQTIMKAFGSTENLSCMIFNANPCTLGHSYIMSLASKRSKGVIVFVIEGKTDSGSKGNHESSCIQIPFETRFQQTKECAKDFSNVLVLPAGPYIISRDDFPSEWSTVEKGRIHSYSIFSSKLLCQMILPQLGIKTIFAGDEPRDEMAEMTLNALRQQSKENGITLKIAERKRIGDKYISSALVREAVSNKDWKAVQATTPCVVYDYLTTLANQC